MYGGLKGISAILSLCVVGCEVSVIKVRHTHLHSCSGEWVTKAEEALR